MPADIAEVVWYNEDSASPLTVSKPGSFASGQILVAIMVQHGPTGSATAMTAPSGWTQQGADLAGTNSQGRVFSHVFNAGDPGTWDFPYSASADVCLMLCRITGADTTPTIVVANTNTTSLTSSYDSPSVTPSGADDLLICTISDISNGTTFTVTVPSGMTDRSKTQLVGGFMAEAGASLQLASGAATGAKTWTSVSPSGTDGGTFSVAVKSTASAAPALPIGLIRQPRTKPLMPARRAKIAVPVAPQFNPPIPLLQVDQPRRLRGLRLWRARILLVPMVGAAPAGPPPLPLTAPRRPVRPPLRRTRRVFPPADTTATAVMPVRPRTQRPAPKPPLRRRITTPTSDTALSRANRSRPRPILQTRPGVTAFVPAPATPPVVSPIPILSLTRHRPMLWQRRRTVFAAPVSKCNCMIARPNTGTITRPNAGLIARPDAGVIQRPCTCA